jgi:hypothetical protein
MAWQHCVLFLGGPSILVDACSPFEVTVPAKNSTSVRLQLGSVGLSAGIHQAQVNVSWLGGETRIPVPCLRLFLLGQQLGDFLVVKQC